MVFKLSRQRIASVRKEFCQEAAILLVPPVRRPYDTGGSQTAHNTIRLPSESVVENETNAAYAGNSGQGLEPWILHYRDEVVLFIEYFTANECTEVNNSVRLDAAAAIFVNNDLSDSTNLASSNTTPDSIIVDVQQTK